MRAPASAGLLLKPPSRWRSINYDVKLGVRDREGGKEGAVPFPPPPPPSPHCVRTVFIDEALHSQVGAPSSPATPPHSARAQMAKLMQRAVVREINPAEHTICLCTGDGNSNGTRGGGSASCLTSKRARADGGNSFPLILAACLRLRFKVEVWCWSHSLSRFLRGLKEKRGAQIKFCFLDEHRDRLCFKPKARVAASPAAAAAAAAAVVVIEADEFDEECVVCMDAAPSVMFPWCVSHFAPSKLAPDPVAPVATSCAAALAHRF